MLLSKPRSDREIINDLDGQLINLYRQARYHLPALLHEMRMNPESRQLFRESQQHVEGLTEIQRAARYAYTNQFSFQGDNASYGVNRYGFVTRSFMMRKLVLFNRRADRLSIENLSWERCVELYDTPDTLFFCDPPYTAGSVKAYASWSIKDVRKLRDTLFSVKGKWIVTLNDDPANREAFKGCKFEDVSTYANMSNTPGRRFGEIIITR